MLRKSQDGDTDEFIINCFVFKMSLLMNDDEDEFIRLHIQKIQ